MDIPYICQIAKGFKSAITLIEQLAHKIEVNSSNDFKPRYNDIYNDIYKWH